MFFISDYIKKNTEKIWLVFTYLDLHTKYIQCHDLNDEKYYVFCSFV